MLSVLINTSNKNGIKIFRQYSCLLHFTGAVRYTSICNLKGKAAAQHPGQSHAIKSDLTEGLCTLFKEVHLNGLVKMTFYKKYFGTIHVFSILLVQLLIKYEYKLLESRFKGFLKDVITKYVSASLLTCVLRIG